MFVMKTTLLKRDTYFGSTFNWFSLNSKICSFVNLQPRKKKKSEYA